MRVAMILGLTLLAGACSMTPTVTTTHTMMTAGEIADQGLVCRQDKPIDTNVPRTICASAEAWASFDARRRRETEVALAQARTYSNVGRFNRD